MAKIFYACIMVLDSLEGQAIGHESRIEKKHQVTQIPSYKLFTLTLQQFDVNIFDKVC